MTEDYEGPERRSSSGRRGSDYGPTPGAQAQLDEHKRILKFGLFAIGALFVILLVVGTIGFHKISSAANDARDAASDATVAGDNSDTALRRVEAFAKDLREAAVRGCQRQNKVRQQQHAVQEIVRDILKGENHDLRNPDPAILALLGLTLADVDGLSDKEIKRNQESRQELSNKLPLSPCEEVYPTPNETDPAKLGPLPR